MKSTQPTVPKESNPNGSTQQLIPKGGELVFVEGLGKKIRKLVVRWAVNKLNLLVNNQLL